MVRRLCALCRHAPVQLPALKVRKQQAGKLGDRCTCASGCTPPVCSRRYSGLDLAGARLLGLKPVQAQAISNYSAQQAQRAYHACSIDMLDCILLPTAFLYPATLKHRHLVTCYMTEPQACAPHSHLRQAAHAAAVPEQRQQATEALQCRRSGEWEPGFRHASLHEQPPLVQSSSLAHFCSLQADRPGCGGPALLSILQQVPELRAALVKLDSLRRVECAARDIASLAVALGLSRAQGGAEGGSNGSNDTASEDGSGSSSGGRSSEGGSGSSSGGSGSGGRSGNSSSSSSPWALRPDAGERAALLGELWWHLAVEAHGEEGMYWEQRRGNLGKPGWGEDSVRRMVADSYLRRSCHGSAEALRWYALTEEQLRVRGGGEAAPSLKSSAAERGWAGGLHGDRGRRAGQRCLARWPA